MHILGMGVVSLALFALWLYCIYNVITTSDADCRNLPKMAWLLIVLLIPTIGSIIWLIAGRPRGANVAGYRARSGPPSPFPEYDRPGRHIAASPEDDAEFLRRCRERAEQQRRQAKRREQKESDN